MTTYAIGDVQGCYETLMRLLDHIGFDDENDQLWFVGDLVNRGPNSLAVLRFVRALGARAVAVLGNHDLHLLAVHHGQRARPKDTLDEVLSAPDRDELMAWLATRPLLHVDAALRFVMVHAGIPAFWPLEAACSRARELEEVLRGDDRREFLDVMYGNRPAIWRDDLRGVDRLRFITNAFTRMRVLDDHDALDLDFKDSAASVPVGLRPWFMDYRGKTFTHRLVFGHWAALNGNCDVPGIHALDTGCVWGGRLSALRLVGQERFSVASVQ